MARGDRGWDRALRRRFDAIGHLRAACRGIAAARLRRADSALYGRARDVDAADLLFECGGEGVLHARLSADGGVRDNGSWPIVSACATAGTRTLELALGPSRGLGTVRPR